MLRREVDKMTRTEQGKGAVIITGASRGIGAAIAQKLAEDGYGVVVNYAADAAGAESVVSAIPGRGGRAIAVRADVAAPDAVADMFERAQRELGPLAALVNNAGTTGEQARIDEQDAHHLTRLMQINVVGPMICAGHAVRAMSTAHGGTRGSIVNIASIAAQAAFPDIEGLVPYEATKGAVVTFSRGLSNEVAPEGSVSTASRQALSTRKWPRPPQERRRSARAARSVTWAAPTRSPTPCRGWSRRPHRTSPAPISPCPAGDDLARIVTKTGPAVEGVAPGYEVIGFTHERASHAKYVVVPAQNLTAKPANVSWEVSGSVGVAGTTAHAAGAAGNAQALTRPSQHPHLGTTARQDVSQPRGRSPNVTSGSRQKRERDLGVSPSS
jgi:NAD(P)-dependent dehydrogenase (short-subunit alcohol dehydrogenase family)